MGIISRELRVSFPKLSITKLTLPYSLLPSIDLTYIEDKYTGSNTWSFMKGSNRSSSQDQSLIDSSKIWVPSNPRGAEMLTPGIVEAESDFYLRRLWGKPSEVCTLKTFLVIVFAT
ncbi:hypothetical protein K1719_044413 [Acacia pycnantha]|nr:hypothetical protein K1719_044413 [Acacia pycnantha]